MGRIAEQRHPAPGQSRVGSRSSIGHRLSMLSVDSDCRTCSQHPAKAAVSSAGPPQSGSPRRRASLWKTATWLYIRPERRGYCRGRESPDTAPEDQGLTGGEIPDPAGLFLPETHASFVI